MSLTNKITFEAGKFLDWDRATNALNAVGTTASSTLRTVADDADCIFFNQTSGNDGNAGTRAAPKATVAGAIAAMTTHTHICQLDATDIDELEVTVPLQTDLGVQGSLNYVPDFSQVDGGSADWGSTASTVRRMRVKPGTTIGYMNRGATTLFKWSVSSGSTTYSTPTIANAGDYELFYSKLTNLWISFGASKISTASNPESTWTTRSSVAKDWASICEFNNYLYILADDGSVYKSSNGASWSLAFTAPTQTGNQSTSKIAASESKIVVKGDYGNFHIYSSNDILLKTVDLSALLSVSTFIDFVYWKGFFYINFGSLSNSLIKTKDFSSFSTVSIGGTITSGGTGYSLIDSPSHLMVSNSNNPPNFSFTVDGENWTNVDLSSSGYSIGDWFTPSLIGTELIFVDWQSSYWESCHFRQDLTDINGYNVESAAAQIDNASWCNFENGGAEILETAKNCDFTGAANFNILTDGATDLEISENLFRSSVFIDSYAQTASTLTLAKNTAIGITYWKNNSELQADNVVKDNIFAGLIASSALTVDTGNLRGFISSTIEYTTNTVSRVDPQFISPSTGDYRLRKTSDGAPSNSPLIGISTEYDPDGTAGTGRDLGAYSFDNSTEADGWTYSFVWPRPKIKIDATDKITSFFQLSRNGTPIAENRPSAMSEGYKLQWENVDYAMKAEIDTLLSLSSTLINVDLFPESTVSTTCQTDGALTAGDIVMVIDAQNIQLGSFITYNGKDYRVIKRYPITGNATQLVFDRQLEDNIPDNEVLNVSQVNGKGEYYIKWPAEIDYTPLDWSQEDNYFNFTFEIWRKKS